MRLLPQLPNTPLPLPIRIRISPHHPLPHRNGGILRPLFRLTTRKAANRIIRIPREKERHAKSVLAALIYDAVQIGKISVIRPSHHHVA